MKKRQVLILQALRELGGRATTKQIATRCNLHVNGVAQSLGAMYTLVTDLGGSAGDRLWQLKE